MFIDSIVFNSEEESKELKDRLTLLLTTPKGTMQMDRNYGIDLAAVLDKPVPVAQNCYAAEVIKAVGDYEPLVEATAVDFEELSGSKFKAIITLIKKEAAQ